MEATATAHRPALRAPWLRIGPDAVAVILFAVALAAGISTIGQESLWFDEAVTVRIGRMGTDRFLELIETREPFWALYYALIRPWMALGDGAAWLRVPSALAGAAVVSLTYLVGRRLVGDAAAVVAALLLVFHAFLLYYAQEARGYTLAVALLVAATLAFVKALERPRWLTWFLYAGLAIGAVYGHFFTGMVIAGHGMVVVVRMLREGWRREWVYPALAMAIVVVASLPLAIWLVNEPPRGFARPVTPERLTTGLAWLAGLPSWQGKPVTVALILVFFAAVLLGGYRLLRGLGSRSDGWRSALVILWMILPLLISLAISFTVKPAFTDRYLIFSLPALALAIGVAITRFRRPAWRLVAAVAVAGIIATGAWSILFETNKPDWNATAELTLRSARPGDVMLTYPGFQITPLDYAFERCDGGPIPPQRYIRPDDEEHVEWVLRNLAREGRRIWVILFDYRSVPRHESLPYLEALEQGRRRVLDSVVHGVRILLYEPDRSVESAAADGRVPPSVTSAPAERSADGQGSLEASRCSATRPAAAG